MPNRQNERAPLPHPKGVEVQEVRDPNGLAGLREAWDDLVERSERATIYQTWEWNEAWWEAFRRGKRLRLLLLKREGALVGIAPLYSSRHLGTPLRRLAFLGTGAADYLDVITTDAEADAVCAALLEHIQHSRVHDLADLQQLRPNAYLREYAERPERAHAARRSLHLVPMEPCPFIPLEATYEATIARLGKKMRSNIGYYDRLLTRTYEDARITLAGPEELVAGMAALFELHQKRWNARLLPGVLGGAKTQSFHARVAERFQERGWLRLHLTHADGRAVAALYCFHYRNRCYYYLGGFAPDLAKFSLGTVLTARAMRQAIDEGCEIFDFLRGAEPYKYRWQPEEAFNARLLVQRPRSIRARALLRLNHFERFVEHRAKEFAERRGRKKTA
jgi:CelD/BcsL family acetyltransferase involved in cellulose biosynthesis